MPQLVVTDRSGLKHVLQADPNRTVMEAIRDTGVKDLLALCGGLCSCATCHVHVDPEFADLLPPRSEDEDALLDECGTRDERSRLSCQIRLNESLEGLRVTIAADD